MRMRWFSRELNRTVDMVAGAPKEHTIERRPLTGFPATRTRTRIK